MDLELEPPEEVLDTKSIDEIIEVEDSPMANQAQSDYSNNSPMMEMMAMMRAQWLNKEQQS